MHYQNLAGRRGLRARCALLIILFASILPAAWGRDGTPLSLDEAIARAGEQNPGLRVFDLKLRADEARQRAADRAPALALGADIENAFGSGEYRGADSAEYTVSLSSVIELGGKRQARKSLAGAARDLTAMEREAKALDLMTEVTQRFIATLALQEKVALGEEAVALADGARRITARATASGAAPEADALRADAALVQGRIDLARLRAAYDSGRMALALALAWGGSQADFARLDGDLFAAGRAQPFETLWQRAQGNPAVVLFAGERRLREAELNLARSRAAGDIDWQLGLRRMDDSGDSALVAGVSMPLFAGPRAQAGIAAAQAELGQVEFRQQDALLSLHQRLFAAYVERQTQLDAVAAMRAEMLPALEKALAQTRAGYAQGRYGYAEWMAAQRELLAARVALIDAAAGALLNQALIEQLTAQPVAP